MPFNDMMGMRLVAEHDDGVTLEMDVRPDLLNVDGVLHGGATAALVDAALGVAILRKWPGCRTTTVEMKLNYLRAVSEGKVVARSRFVKAGRTLVVGQVEVVDEAGERTAFGLLTYMLLRLPPRAETTVE